MTMTLTLGWWLVPALITAVAFFLAWRRVSDDEPAMYPVLLIMKAIDMALSYGAALVASLVAWLIYFILV